MERLCHAFILLVFSTALGILHLLILSTDQHPLLLIVGGGVVNRSIVVGVAIAWLTIFGLIETIHAIASRSASVARVVGWAQSTSSSHLGVTGVVDLLVALPERTSADT